MRGGRDESAPRGAPALFSCRGGGPWTVPARLISDATVPRNTPTGSGSSASAPRTILVRPGCNARSPGGGPGIAGKVARYEHDVAGARGWARAARPVEGPDLLGRAGRGSRFCQEGGVRREDTWRRGRNRWKWREGQPGFSGRLWKRPGAPSRLSLRCGKNREADPRTTPQRASSREACVRAPARLRARSRVPLSELAGGVRPVL